MPTHLFFQFVTPPALYEALAQLLLQCVQAPRLDGSRGVKEEVRTRSSSVHARWQEELSRARPARTSTGERKSLSRAALATTTRKSVNKQAEATRQVTPEAYDTRS